jgi:dihydrofolate reductase
MIVSIFATHADGSLNVPRIPEDRALLRTLSKGHIIICGSTVGAQIPRSLKKIVVSRVPGEEYASTVEAVMQAAKKSSDEDGTNYVIYGGHRIYAVANKYADKIVNIVVSAETPRQDPAADETYGYTFVPSNFVLESSKDLCNFTDDASSPLGHMVNVYVRSDDGHATP